MQRKQPEHLVLLETPHITSLGVMRKISNMHPSDIYRCPTLWLFYRSSPPGFPKLLELEQCDETETLHSSSAIDDGANRRKCISGRTADSRDLCS